MSDTITAFNEFSAGTVIRSAQVNENFNNFRGDFVPINSDSASASDNAHDLGKADHRWKICYAESIYFGPGDTSGTWRCQVDATNTSFI